jgi:Fe-Mn family superoxide dismutase
VSLVITGVVITRVIPKNTHLKYNCAIDKQEIHIMQEFFKYMPQEQLKPSGLVGISDDQISDHWNLYVGYVNQTNKLNEELVGLAREGNGAALAYADRRRRYGFEYNGMVLHEYYFGNLKANTTLAQGSLKQVIEKTWGSYEQWQVDFANTGKSRGIGWAIMYADTTTGQLTNHFIQEHENGNIAGFAPVIVMDVWEHAYMVDHKAAGRADYITSFMKNIYWSKIEERFDATQTGNILKRF